MNRPDRRDGDLARIVLGVLTIGGLMAATFWILSPFLGAIIWAVMIVVATWSPMLRVQRWAGNRRWVAVTIMSLLLLLVLIVPLAAAVGTIVSHVDDIIVWAKGLRDFKVPAHVDIRSEPLPRNASGKLLKNVLRGEGEVSFTETM